MSKATKVNALLYWVQQATKDYDNVDIKSFSSPAFATGLAWCALIHHFRPDLIPYKELSPNDAKRNLELAFKVAEDELGITNYLEVEDLLDVKRPEPKTIQLQLNEYRRVLGSVSRTNSSSNVLDEGDSDEEEAPLKRLPSNGLMSLGGNIKAATLKTTVTAEKKNSPLVVTTSSNNNNIDTSSLVSNSSVTASTGTKGLVARFEGNYNSTSSSSPTTSPSLKNAEDEKKRISSLEQEIERIKKENSTLLSQVKDSEQQLKQMETVYKQQNEQLKQKISQLRQDFESEKNSIENTKKDELERKKKELNEKQSVIESLEKEKLKILEQIEKSSKENNNISQNEIAELINQLKEKENQLIKVEKEKDNISNDLQQKLDSKEKEKLQIEKQLRELKEQVNQEKQKLENEMNQKSKNQSLELNKLEENIKKLTQEKNSLQLTMNEKQNTVEKLNVDIQKLQTELKETKTKLDRSSEDKKNKNELDESLKKLTKEKNIIQETLNEKQKTIDTLNNEIQKLKSELKETQSKLEKSNQEVHSLKSELSSVKSQYDLLNKQVTEIRQSQEKDKNSTKDSIEKVRLEKQKVEEQLFNITNQLKQKEEKLNELEKIKLESKKQQEIISQMKTESEKLKNEKDTSFDKLQENLRLEKLQLETEWKNKLEKTVKELEKQHQQETSVLDLQLEDLRDQVIELKKASKQVETKLLHVNEEKTQETQQQTNQLEELRIKVKELEKQKVEAQSSLNTYATSLKQLLEQDRLERYIIDQTIVCNETYSFGNQSIPVPVKALYYSIKQWSEKSEIFGKNVLAALSYKMNSCIYENNLFKANYWLNTMMKLLHLLKLDKLEDKIISNMKNNVTQKTFNILLNDYKEDPTSLFLELDTINIPETTNGVIDVKKPNVDEFLKNYCQLIYNSYYDCLKLMYSQVKSLILEKLFGVVNNQTPVSLGKMGDVKVDVIVKKLKEWMEALKRSQIDNRIIIHVFETIANLMDSLIFNQFLTMISNEKQKYPKGIKDASMNHGIHIKMSVSFLESFFFEEHLTAGLDVQNLFHLSREAADVCVLGQKDLLSQGSDLREVVCPHLTTNQIAILLCENGITKQDYNIPSLNIMGFTDSTTFTKRNDCLFLFENNMMSVQSLALVNYPLNLEQKKQQMPFLFFNVRKDNSVSTSSTMTNNNITTSTLTNISKSTTTTNKFGLDMDLFD
ncbi:hypothetical protein ABK040_000671 [Willaertia magna]